MKNEHTDSAEGCKNALFRFSTETEKITGPAFTYGVFTKEQEEI